MFKGKALFSVHSKWCGALHRSGTPKNQSTDCPKGSQRRYISSALYAAYFYFLSITLQYILNVIFSYNIEYCFWFFCHIMLIRCGSLIKILGRVYTILTIRDHHLHSSKEPFLGCGKLGNWSMLKLQSFLDFSLPLHLFFLGWSSRLPDKIRSSLRKSTKGEGSFKSLATFSFSAKSSK